MSTTAPTTETPQHASPRKDHPWWAVPAILSIIMLSSGGLFVLIAYGIRIMSSAG
ncbi:hypothetical protein [Demequina subtropica]|uniref:hypothetical protein n=1 Tax=Demequina subtropica TaxID=1638989 RepID=UPI000A7E007E|nr:hypothetical protein [Demequina subtropica]